MEQADRQNQEEIKMDSFTFDPDTVVYPHCLLHNKIDAMYVPKTEEGWNKHAPNIIKCIRCLKKEGLDSSKFELVETILEEYAQRLESISKQRAQ